MVKRKEGAINKTHTHTLDCISGGPNNVFGADNKKHVCKNKNYRLHLFSLASRNSEGVKRRKGSD